MPLPIPTASDAFETSVVALPEPSQLRTLGILSLSAPKRP